MAGETTKLLRLETAALNTAVFVSVSVAIDDGAAKIPR